MAAATPRHHLLVETYCVLCRQDVEQVSPKEMRRLGTSPQGWEKQVYCFFGIPASDTEPYRNHMFRFKPVSEGGMYVNTAYNKAISSLLLRRNTILCYGECGACRLETTANLVHVACHQLATARLGRLSIQLLCDIAWMLRPVVSWRMERRLIDRPRCLSRLPSRGISKSTDSGSVLHAALEKLPIELQSTISAMIPKGPFQSLAFALETVDWIEKQGLLSSPEPVRRTLVTDLPFATTPSVSSLKASRVEVLGEVCLASLHAGSDATDGEIELSDQPIEGVQYSLSTYGVTAIRIHYQDGSTSPWLGKYMPKWSGFIRLKSIQELQVLSDGVKILSLGHQAEAAEPERPFPISTATQTTSARGSVQLIWDRDLGALQGSKSSLIDVSMYETIVRGNPKAKFAQCLPLPKADDRVNALTLFCSQSGISCIQINGDERQMLGKPTSISCPITFYLRPGEEVDSFYAVARRSPEPTFCQGPYLLVQTTFNRCLYYGPYIMPTWDPTSGYVSSLGNEDTHRTTAIFTDPGKQNTQNHTTIGVIQEQRQQTRAHRAPLYLPTLTTLDEESFCSRNWRQAFVTKGAFAGAKELRVQKENLRCSGVLAEFHDGAIEILGSWNPAAPEDIYTVYQSEKDGPLQSVNFYFSDGSPHERYVESIIVNDTEPTEQDHFKWDNLTTELAWNFTSNHDMIQYWDGTHIDVTTTDDNLPYIKAE